MKTYPAYKDSGYDWTGNIPEHWDMVQLKFAAPRKTDQTENVKEFGLQIALENIEGKTGRLLGSGSFEGLGNIFKKGDVLFNKLRPYLCKVVVAPDSGVAVSELLVLRPEEGVDGRYLFYRLLDSTFISVVDGSTYGAKMPRANWDFIGNLKIPLPHLPEQQAIADFLDRKTTQIDRLIAKKQRQIELLQEQRTALINQAVTKGLNPDVPMKDSGIEWLGEIPSHWDLKRLGRITSLIMDIDHKMPDAVEDGIPFLSAKDLLNDGTLNFVNDVKKISEEDFKKLSRKVQPRRNDIVYSRIGARLGKARLVETDERFLVSYSCCVVRVLEEMAIPEYICFLMDSEILLTEAKGRTVGIGVPDLGLGEIAKFPIPLPPKPEQEKILQFVKQKNTQIRLGIKKVSDQIAMLNEYRTALISESVTGKIDVRTAG